LAQADYWAGGSVTSCVTGGTTSATATLVGAGINTCQRITDVLVKTIGTVTAYNISIFKNDGSTLIASIGGQLGGAAVPPGPMSYSFSTPVNCAVNDNAKVIATCTGASATEVTVNYIFGSK